MSNSFDPHVVPVKIQSVKCVESIIERITWNQRVYLIMPDWLLLHQSNISLLHDQKGSLSGSACEVSVWNYQNNDGGDDDIANLTWLIFQCISYRTSSFEAYGIPLKIQSMKCLSKIDQIIIVSDCSKIDIVNRTWFNLSESPKYLAPSAPMWLHSKFKVWSVCSNDQKNNDVWEHVIFILGWIWTHWLDVWLVKCVYGIFADWNTSNFAIRAWKKKKKIAWFLLHILNCSILLSAESLTQEAHNFSVSVTINCWRTIE